MTATKDKIIIERENEGRRKSSTTLKFSVDVTCTLTNSGEEKN